MTDTPDDDQLARVAVLAPQLRRQEDEVARATELLQSALTAYRYTAETLLPEAMREVGLADFTLTNGSKVTIDRRFVGSKVTDPQALAWIEEQGASDLIKTAIHVDLPVAMVEEAREIMAMLEGHRSANQFSHLTLGTYVHQSTIAAFVKELYEAGVADLPLETLGVRQRVIARVGERQFKNKTLTSFLRKDQ
jgi:hypothetical protein